MYNHAHTHSTHTRTHAHTHARTHLYTPSNTYTQRKEEEYGVMLGKHRALMKTIRNAGQTKATEGHVAPPLDVQVEVGVGVLLV